MDIASMILIILGLTLFETISSIDNAIINAEVLSTMGKKARRWFLIWGILIAVFLVRGLLPWLIVWLTMPGLGPVDAITATFSNDPRVQEAIRQSAPVLLSGGGVFLLFLFIHWLFIDEKNIGFPFEPFFIRHGVWFYAVVSVLLAVITWFAMAKNNMMAFSAIMGSTAFFITHGFRHSAEEKEKSLKAKNISDISKILYLEVLDMSFSIDGVLGAFAFTLSVPLILIGNGIGAVIVRQLTVGNIERVKKYKYLKNGAMYSILCLGIIMLLESFEVHVPAWISPVITFIVIGYFFLRSIPGKNEAKKDS
jgi:uncharacterized protein